MYGDEKIMDYPQITDFLAWIEREAPKETDKALQQAMLRIKQLIENKLKEAQNER